MEQASNTRHLDMRGATKETNSMVVAESRIEASEGYKRTGSGSVGFEGIGHFANP